MNMENPVVRDTRRKKKSRDNLTTVLAVLALLIFLGILTFAAIRIKAHRAAAQEAAAAPAEPTVFGYYDTHVITEEPDLTWVGVDANFKPVTDELDIELQEFIYNLCESYNIDYSFVMAIIFQESHFSIDVKSSTNDIGLMQINENNFEWLAEAIGIDDLTDPYQNVRAGTYILRKLFERYEDTAMVLMAYNHGEYGASKLWKRGIYSTAYTEVITQWQKQIQETGEVG